MGNKGLDIFREIQIIFSTYGPSVLHPKRTGPAKQGFLFGHLARYDIFVVLMREGKC